MPARRTWSALDDVVLHTLRGNGWTMHAIARFMCCGHLMIREHAQRLGLPLRSQHRWTGREDEMLRRAYADQPTQALADALGVDVHTVYTRAKRLGLRKSDAFFASDKAGRIRRGRDDPRMRATQFRPGHRSWNTGKTGYQAGGRSAETRFKAGRPACEARNYLPIGSERVNHDGYVERKMTDDRRLVPARRWVAVHRLVWIAAHGPVPAGHVIAFRAGRHTTVVREITVERLECISLVENMRRNTIHNRYPPEVVEVVRLKGALKRKLNRLAESAAQRGEGS